MYFLQENEFSFIWMYWCWICYVFRADGRNTTTETDLRSLCWLYWLYIDYVSDNVQPAGLYCKINIEYSPWMGLFYDNDLLTEHYPAYYGRIMLSQSWNYNLHLHYLRKNSPLQYIKQMAKRQYYSSLINCHFLYNRVVSAWNIKVFVFYIADWYNDYPVWWLHQSCIMVIAEMIKHWPKDYWSNL